ncbi:hypothetical protein ISS85_04350 [Candidatus Microgenomates bacterium]|nr:hypothetical protein [Candidatus Microgenomates bacterium]
MIPYQTKTKKISATRFSDIWKESQLIYSKIKSRTKRKPYIRSAYFSKQKIFFSYFWIHLSQKSPRQRRIRLKFFPCAIDLIKNSRNTPSSKINPNKRTEILHRFAGLTKNKELFFLQIKENIKTDKKYLMSVFPGE